MQQRNVEGIRKFSKLKSSTATRKAEQAIERLLNRDMKVNFNTVSLEAGVSKPFLYTQPELRSRIEELRERTERWGELEPERSHLHLLERENEKLKQKISKLEQMIQIMRNA
ncbi:hypothetical protein SAMN02799630_04344 [Paenibacillus sp. UNCCL117]|uniref:DUF6262 family protein n=1 Tax=unclassified Paenibacillus TaxID=185978 RepID=UPI0008842ACC|nr:MULTISPECIES: DUF6262 family protein [unclassified Paenibacillus]SDD96789.1 hypothetical protein SAMN04488602_11649 [Paenibacillus sp. cl123]SFW56318.1 hypothetical protein SAMN02799630_04344 [Paenibacillus sp. UNCCL117]